MRHHLWLAPLLAVALVGCSSAAGPRQTKQDTQAPASASESAPAAQSAALPQITGAAEDGAPKEASAKAMIASNLSVRTGSVPIDLARLKQLQAEVDAGHLPGNLDPLDVFYSAAPGLGLNPGQDLVRLEKQSAVGPGGALPTAYLYVLHNGDEYIAELIQPVRTGLTGIWAVNSLRGLGSLADNQQKMEAVRGFFQAIADQDREAAAQLLSPRLRQSLSTDGQALGSGIRFEGLERSAWLSPGPDVMYVTVRLGLNRSQPSAWGDGENGRFITFMQENGHWLIAAIATSP